MAFLFGSGKFVKLTIPTATEFRKNYEEVTFIRSIKNLNVWFENAQDADELISSLNQTLPEHPDQENYSSIGRCTNTFELTDRIEQIFKKFKVSNVREDPLSYAISFPLGH